MPKKRQTMSKKRPDHFFPTLLIVVFFSVGILSKPQIRHRGGDFIQPNPTNMQVSDKKPTFAFPMPAVNIVAGRDAKFVCQVDNLGGYRVGWVKTDTKAIQAIHNHVITHNPRVSVSHTDLNTWVLHVKEATLEDRGEYMCQVNTNPMISQTGLLNVVVPPDFKDGETSGDVIVPEGAPVQLFCNPIGIPHPNVTWRREESVPLNIRHLNGTVETTQNKSGEVLVLPKVLRKDMGYYMCIASNHIHPSVSKRMMLEVQFQPSINVPNQLVGAPLGTNVSLECLMQAYPNTINFWIKDKTRMIVASSKYQVENMFVSIYETYMKLYISHFDKDDVGSYSCSVKNSLGTVESTIRLYEIPLSTTTLKRPQLKTNRVPSGSGNVESNDVNAFYYEDEANTTGTALRKANSEFAAAYVFFFLPVILLFYAM